MLGIIVSTILIAIIVNLFLKKLHLPTIIGYIFTGTLITYIFNLHDAVENLELKEIAEFGVVFLMFTIGLEFSINHLKRMKKEVFLTGHLQIIFTTIIFVVSCMYIFNIDFQTSMVIGAALSLSSTAIVLKTFNETREINKRHGQRVLGILIMQDIAVIPILLMIGFFSSQGQSIAEMLTKTTISAITLLFILYLFGKYLLEPFLHHVLKTNSEELFVGSVLLIAIGASFIAHYFGFSYSLGAFIAGMLISETKYKYQVESDLIPFRNLLLGVFFITVGMQINFSVISEYIHIIAIILPLILIIKFIVIFAIVRIDDTKRVAFKTALSLVQIGEFSLAVVELARSKDLINPSYSQILIVTVVISMIITPIILKNLSKITGIIIPDDILKSSDEYILDSNLKDHIVVLGYGYFGQAIVDEIKKYDKPYIIVESNIKFFELGRSMNEPIILGNGTRKTILHSVNVTDASAIIVAVDNPDKLQMICKVIDELTHNKKTVVKVNKEEQKEVLQSLNLKHIVVESTEVSKALVKEALEV